MATKTQNSSGQKIVASNRKARHQYHVQETFETGIVLQGTEVKSLRAGKANLKESYATFEGGELYLTGCHISPYSHGGYSNHDPIRPRKLLMHKKELDRLFSKVQQKGLTLVPLSIYFVRGKAKVKLALATGKKLFDKREDIKKRDIERELQKQQSEKW